MDENRRYLYNCFIKVLISDEFHDNGICTTKRSSLKFNLDKKVSLSISWLHFWHNQHSTAAAYPLELKRRVVAVILRLRKPRQFSIDKRRRKRNDSYSHRISSSSSLYIIRIFCNPHVVMNVISTATAKEEVFLSATTNIWQPLFSTSFQSAQHLCLMCAHKRR